MTREFGASHGTDTWGFRVGIDLPILKWARPMLQAPAADRERHAQEAAATRGSIRLEVEALVERLRARAGELEPHRQTVEPLAARAVELSEHAVAAGQSDLTQVLTATARQLLARQTYLDKLLDYRWLEIELDQTLGNTI